MPGWRRAVPFVLVLSSLASLLLARGGDTVPLHSARSGMPCASCHFDPNGGGPRTELGFGFAKNRHSVTPEDSTSAWAGLELVNRVGDSFPLYVSVNHRFMLLADRTDFVVDEVDRIGFFNMENSLHLAFQPHRSLTMVYTRDGFDDGSKSQEAFGLVGGAPGYIKAGRFRTPFGLRLEDHTVATRNGFLDFRTLNPFDLPRYLPYDPRRADMGIELGGSLRQFFGRAAILNGVSHPFAAPFSDATAQAFAAKAGYDGSWYHGGFSFFYDRLASRSFMRYAYYGMLSKGPVALIGEIGAGSDETGGAENDVLAAFAEIDYAPLRWLNFRARYDHMNLGEVGLAPGDITFDRYALEGEIMPVPFAELRWTARRIEPDEGESEDQAYLQFHFLY